MTRISGNVIRKAIVERRRMNLRNPPACCASENVGVPSSDCSTVACTIVNTLSQFGCGELRHQAPNKIQFKQRDDRLRG
jgi:hypothetical protein